MEHGDDATNSEMYKETRSYATLLLEHALQNARVRESMAETNESTTSPTVTIVDIMHGLLAVETDPKALYEMLDISEKAEAKWRALQDQNMQDVHSEDDGGEEEVSSNDEMSVTSESG